MPAVNGVGKPCAGEPHARFDGRELETSQISALTPGADLVAGGFEDTELAVLRLATELIQTKSVGAELFEQVRRDLGDEATVEVLMLINRWTGLALMLNALDVDLDTHARITIPQTH